MMKSGASFHDKARICRLAGEGKNADQISALTKIRPEHVAAIVEQHKAGSLKLLGRHAASYAVGEIGKEENIEPQTAASIVEKHAQDEQASLARENAEQADEIERLKAEVAAAKKAKRKAPAKRKPRAKRAAPSQTPSEAQPEVASA